MENVGFVAMTAEDACVFFQRRLEKEAITPEERMKVLEEMLEEKRILLAGKFDEKTSKALNQFMDKTNHKGIIGFKKSKE